MSRVVYIRQTQARSPTHSDPERTRYQWYFAGRHGSEKGDMIWGGISLGGCSFKSSIVEICEWLDQYVMSYTSSIGKDFILMVGKSLPY
ncbi:hypothetical protein CEXT_525781 [Caerostris extrusa]|uniref:Uncharacterized protein n=1 Tax=Caerostris extrusa TaxID=172846 RepID=A0AAV4P1I2_CAEEX|nr:hypothetical protein CEXT_525781 [Caerostris extrusa]